MYDRKLRKTFNDLFKSNFFVKKTKFKFVN